MKRKWLACGCASGIVRICGFFTLPFLECFLGSSSWTFGWQLHAELIIAVLHRSDLPFVDVFLLRRWSCFLHWFKSCRVISVRNYHCDVLKRMHSSTFSLTFCRIFVAGKVCRALVLVQSTPVRAICGTQWSQKRPCKVLGLVGMRLL